MKFDGRTMPYAMQASKLVYSIHTYRPSRVPAMPSEYIPMYIPYNAESQRKVQAG